MTKKAIDTKTLVKEVEEQVIKWRRHLHENPELSFQEVKTAQYVYETLQSFGNLELSRPSATSIMARLIGSKPGKVMAFRADMDALPIQEETNLAFSSKNDGVMHACGHDGHTAMLLGAAKVLSGLKDDIHGEVRFLFQHAEEMFPGGAQEMVAAGVLEGVDAITGLHLASRLPLGVFGVVYGPTTSAGDTFDVTIQGKGGHAAKPHKCIDPVAIVAQLINGINQFISRKVDASDRVILSITKMQGGTAHNIIPEFATFGGTVRTFNPEVRKQIPKWIEQYAKGLTEANDCSYRMDYRNGYSSIVNDQTITSLAEQTIIQLFGEESFLLDEINMGSEDFSAFSNIVPGSFVFLGARDTKEVESYPHHHPLFVFDEKALELGVMYFVEIGLTFNEKLNSLE
ncbi:M20 metallopeptidase family protein [Sporosarcina limicola]|uniref:Amidohydrolase n=1 Tax=Sporosarcina limicola TaxID=34101 RepID=A0A927MHK9_9BACL|nr:amidohydrolase [Sporosarcina limicola]MBE1553926.1 amidohydrolase [Sporosarcina limicola]